MDYTFITITEAARLTGQSDIAIMRAIKDYLQQPGINSADILKKEPRDNDFIYLVNREVLLRELEKTKDAPPASQRGEQGETSPTPEQNPPTYSTDAQSEQTILEAKNEMIAMLQKVVDTQDRQIEDLSEKIDQLIERDRETNILLKTLHDKIFLLSAKGGSPPKADVPLEYASGGEPARPNKKQA